MTNPYGLDTLGLWDATAGLPEQLGGALDASLAVLRRATLPDAGDLRAVVVCGMGSSGLAGDVTASHPGATIPVLVVKGYDLPAFVGPDTLVMAVSWSGDTEETLSAARAARASGAPLVVVSGGGALFELAGEGATHFPLPAGLPAARTAWGACVVPLLLTLSQLGFLPDVTPSLATAVAGVGRRRDALLHPGNPAEAVARRIGRTMPLVYGASGLNAVAAWRWKTQINENAKTPAFVALQPDLSHNEVAGWGQHGDVTRQVLSLVTLRQAGEHPGLARQVGYVTGAVDEVMSDVIEVWAEGEDDLGRLFDLALFGDFVSLHLAGREGIDPGPVPAVLEARQSTTQA